MTTAHTALAALVGLALATAALCAAAATPSQPDATAIKPGDTVVVTQDKAKFSLGPKVLAELAKGTEFRVTSVNGDWVGGVINIAGKQEKGWVKSGEVAVKNAGAARVAENKVPPTSGPAKPTPPPPQLKTPAGGGKPRLGELDTGGLGKSMDIVTSEAMAHAEKLFPGDFVEAASILYPMAGQFIRDENGNCRDAKGELHPNLNGVTFTQAVKNVTSERVADTRNLLGAPKDKRGDVSACLALVVASRAFVQGKDQFNGRAFNAALAGIDKARLDKTAMLLGESGVDGRVVAMVNLLTACARFLDARGNFDAAQFKARFDALPAKQLAGDNEDSRITAFLELMRPGPTSRPMGAANITSRPAAKSPSGPKCEVTAEKLLREHLGGRADQYKGFLVKGSCPNFRGTTEIIHNDGRREVFFILTPFAVGPDGRVVPLKSGEDYFKAEFTKQRLLSLELRGKDLKHRAEDKNDLWPTYDFIGTFEGNYESGRPILMDCQVSSK